tara:strand:- start:317 stop:598 length:282 start_codon:yes stop_codon:yes gene_type:complete
MVLMPTTASQTVRKPTINRFHMKSGSERTYEAQEQQMLVFADVSLGVGSLERLLVFPSSVVLNQQERLAPVLSKALVVVRYERKPPTDKPHLC